MYVCASVVFPRYGVSLLRETCERWVQPEMRNSRLNNNNKIPGTGGDDNVDCVDVRKDLPKDEDENGDGVDRNHGL